MDPGAPNDLEASLYPPDPALLDPLASKGLPETQKTGEAPSAVGAAEDLSTYTFSRRRLNPVQKDSSREPLVLVACGSFSPITYLHLRMFEMAYDYIKFHTNYEVIGSYLSPVADAYNKPGLASAHDRMRMCELATQYSSSSIDLDKWEALQQVYQPTAFVLDHFSQEVNGPPGSGVTKSGNGRPVHIALLAGADLLQSMNIPDVWSDESMSHIMRHYPLFVLERYGTDIQAAKASLQRWNGEIHVIPQTIQNDVSSTKIRQFRRDGLSIRYLVPDEVLKYIEEQGLYAGEASGVGSKT